MKETGQLGDCFMFQTAAFYGLPSVFNYFGFQVT